MRSNGRGADLAKRHRSLFSLVIALALLAISAPATLAVNYTVIYDANPNMFQAGVTSGSIPSVSGNSFAANATVTVAGNTGTLARQGFALAGWNTAADGSGTTYALGAGTFVITQNTTLYAKWSIPSSARLIGSGGSVVTVLNTNSVTNGDKCTAGNIRGVTSNGTHMFFRPSANPGWICKLNMSGVVVAANNVGTVLASTVPTDSMALSYSSECIFVRGTGAATSTVYCIDVNDWSITARTLPTSLFAGQGWGTGNLIDFPDGRIGAVSQPNQSMTVGTGAGECPATMYCKYLRLYNVIGTGKNVTFTTSEDIVLADSDSGWPGDDHGIATDGTYMYEIQYAAGYKVWALRSGAPSYIVFNGDASASCGASTGVSPTSCLINNPVNGTTALTDNATYIGHNHATGTYMMGDYSNPKIYVSNSVLPPAGPGSLPPAAVFNSYGLGSGLTTATYRANNTITVNLNTPSKVTFYAKKSPIPGCRNISTSGTSPNIVASCTWKPSAHGGMFLSILANPVNTQIAASNTGQFQIVVAARSNKR